MRNLRRLAWVAVVAAATAGSAAAQGGGVAGVNVPTATGGNLGTFQNAPANTASTLNTAGTTGTGGTNAGSTGTQIQLSPVEQAPTLKAPSTYATKSPSTVQASNFLGPTFANPYYSGLLANTRNGAFTPGGFGDPTFGKAAGATAKVGGTGAAFATDPGGQIVQLPRQIAYTAKLKFTPPTVPAPRLQADLRGLIDRAGLTVPAGSVQVLVADGNAVVLRGTVRDDDEARLVEGMVRLTPGVSRITNELSYPR
jgi:hypothetical protein